ncbi:MAG TPA: hypothetical protein VKD65_08600, partial [Candidatus Angelobacter sp.]|nr:hypothetical protein [Candidatus Angelobacter sp.]
HPSQDELINFTYDWQLEDISVLDDSDDSVARSYVVESTPTTFLISADRIIQQRWNGFASASQLALSIETLVGVPVHRQVNTTEVPATLPVTACPNEAQAQAKFAGLGLARPLSDELWAVDGGGSWGVGSAFPIQWILLDTKNLNQRMPLHILVLGQYRDSQQTFPLSNQAIELLTADVASGLLSGDTNPPALYSLVTTVFLERAGCLQIRAVITREGSTVPLYQGSLVIAAR